MRANLSSMAHDALHPDYRNFNAWLSRHMGSFPAAKVINNLSPSQRMRTLDVVELYHARQRCVPMNLLQQFEAPLADVQSTVNTTTPTTVKTNIFTVETANHYWPLPYGVNGIAMPRAGTIFEFLAGGRITTPGSGTLILDPTHGPGTGATNFGTDMGASAAQSVTISLSNAPWTLRGYLHYRTVSATATASTAWYNGNFWGPGTVGTAGSGWEISFGSSAAVSVDTSGLGSAGTFGAMNIAATFSVTAGVIDIEWAFVKQVN